MSISDLRQAFNNGAAGKIQCTGVALVYCDGNGWQGGAKRDHQLLVFKCSNGQLYGWLVKPGQDVNLGAQLCGQKAMQDDGT